MKTTVEEIDRVFQKIKKFALKKYSSNFLDEFYYVEDKKHL